MKTSTLRARWAVLGERWGYRRMRALGWFLGIGVTALAIHLLFITGFDHSALLYMLVPYSVSAVILWFRKYTESQSATQRYGRHLVSTLIVFLGSSIILREGFICMIFFLPIYVVIVTIGYAFALRSESKRKLGNSTHATVFPLLILAFSLEGTIEPLTFERENTVTVSQFTDLSTAQVKQNLAKPFNLDGERHWMISVFPMPYRIEAGSLQAGDIHRSYTRYHRWFFTNTHEGVSELLIEEVGEHHITTKVISDSTFFASYLNMRGTEIDLTPLRDGGTRIELSMNYERKLDPAWYFHPLQRFAVSKMAELLIRDVMVREE